MIRGEADYDELRNWTRRLPDDAVVADADRTFEFIRSLCHECIDELDEVQRRCLARPFGDVADEDAEQVFRRLSLETPVGGRLPPGQARNRLIFALTTCLRPMNWEMAEYLVDWAEQAGIPASIVSRWLRSAAGVLHAP